MIPGNSGRQGGHQLAQKCTKTTEPLSSASLTILPEGSGIANPAAGFGEKVETPAPPTADAAPTETRELSEFELQPAPKVIPTQIRAATLEKAAIPPTTR